MRSALTLTCLAASLAMAAPALALSCLRPDVTQSFQNAAEREEVFVMALGELTRTGPDVATPNDIQIGTDLPANYAFPARFTGRGASGGGFLTALTVDVTVEVSCVSAWCGGVPLDSYALVFLRRDADGYVFEAGLCDPFSYTNPTEHDLMEVIGCLNGASCGAGR